MQTRDRFTPPVVAAALAGLLVGLLPPAAEAALARRQNTGATGLSGTLSSNRTVRKQQLIADPEVPDDGSTSVEYDPTIVGLVGFGFGPGYRRPGGNEDPAGFVEVRQGEGTPFLVDLDVFVNTTLANPGYYTETGYVQLLYTRIGAAGQIDPTTGGFMVVDNDPGVTGIEGVDTHGLEFELNENLSDETVARYTIYADTGTHGNQPDFMAVRTAGEPYRIEANEIASVTVEGPFPEPSAAAVLGAAGAAALLRRRRSR